MPGSSVPAGDRAGCLLGGVLALRALRYCRAFQPGSSGQLSAAGAYQWPCAVFVPGAGVVSGMGVNVWRSRLRLDGLRLLPVAFGAVRLCSPPVRRCNVGYMTSADVMWPHTEQQWKDHAARRAAAPVLVAEEPPPVDDEPLDPEFEETLF